MTSDAVGTNAVGIDLVLDLLRCPLCRQPFTRVGGSVRCPSGHGFDLAKQGHLNLLGRTAPEHADTADMVGARARFLAAGHFDPVSEVLRELVTQEGPVGNRSRVLEVGAGTGHYISRLLDATGGRGLALDISPAAARRAARAHPRLAAVVADVWAPLPLPDIAVDVVLAVFAPRNPGEFARVLAPGGLVVVVTPEPDHLLQLRERLGLLDIEAGKGDRLAATMPPELGWRTSRVSRFEVDLDHGALVDLVAMGPNAFHRDPAEIDSQLRALALPLRVSVAVTVNVWRRR